MTKEEFFKRHENEILSLAKEMKENDKLNIVYETKYGQFHMILLQ